MASRYDLVPTKVTYASGIDPTKCTVTLGSSSVANSGTTTVTLQAKNSSSQNITQGGATVVFSNSGGSSTVSFGSVTDNNNGSYVCTITGTGSGTATTVSATINGSAVTQTQSLTVTSFQTPDIIVNASFEEGDSPNHWDGYNDGGGGSPTASIDTTQAYAGSQSVVYAWTPNPGGDSGCAMYHTFGGSSYDRVWIRGYFKLTAHITQTWKWWRFEDAGLSGGIGGLWVEKDGGGLNGNGLFNVVWDAEDSAIGTTIGLTEAQVIDGNWHCIEMDYQRNGGSTGYPEASFWFDGNAQYPEYNGHSTVKYWDGSQQKSSWVNGRINAGMRNSTTKLGAMFHMGTLNKNNTTTGQCNIDYVGVSSLGRIGP